MHILYPIWAATDDLECLRDDYGLRDYDDIDLTLAFGESPNGSTVMEVTPSTIDHWQKQARKEALWLYRECADETHEDEEAKETLAEMEAKTWQKVAIKEIPPHWDGVVSQFVLASEGGEEPLCILLVMRRSIGGLT